MFRTILVATDLEPRSAAAMRTAVDLARKMGSRLFAAHVVKMPPTLRKWKGAIFRDDLKAYEALLQRQIQTSEARLDQALSRANATSSGGVRAIVRAGDPAETLAQIVDEIDPDLVVVARGRDGALGDVAELLVRLTGRTVMVAPVRAKRAWPQRRARVIRRS